VEGPLWDGEGKMGLRGRNGNAGILERWSRRSRCGQALLTEGCELVV